MAIYLFKLVRRGLRERNARQAIPTMDDSHLLPEQVSGHLGMDTPNQHDPTCQSTTANSHINLISAEETARHRAEARRRSIRQWKLMLGLALPNFLAAVDVTIVAPAIPLISSHFNRLSGSFNWIVAAYTLTFTTFVPVSGQIADTYGRHFALQFEMVWIMIGSILCAAAHSWGMLLLGRALQGLGAAGIMSLSRIILSDGATLAENASNNSLLSLISAVSYSVGPVIGGYLADASWRYLFILPIGVSALAIVMVFFLMHGELAHGSNGVKAGKPRRPGYTSGLAIIDWPGLVLFIVGVGCVILAVQWGGTQYAWNSPEVVAPFVVGGVLCSTFFGYEYLLGPGRAVSRLFPRQVPMIPSTLFRQKDTALLMIVNFSAGISFVSAFYFISYYWQLAEGLPSSEAGVQLLYYTPGLGVGVIAATLLCNHWPRQTFFPLVWGSIVEGVGLSLLAYAVSIRHQSMVRGFLVVAGAGTGLRLMPVALHAAGIWSTRISSIQSLLSFMLPLGETIGISVMGSVFSNKLDLFLTGIHNSANGTLLPATGPPSLDMLNNLPATARLQVQDAAARAVMWALISVLPFVGLSIVASLFLGNVWIGKGTKEPADGKPGRVAEKGQVLYSVYLSAIMSGRVKAYKQDLDVDSGHDLPREKVDDIELSGGVAPLRTAHVANERSN